MKENDTSLIYFSMFLRTFGTTTTLQEGEFEDSERDDMTHIIFPRLHGTWKYGFFIGDEHIDQLNMHVNFNV